VKTSTAAAIKSGRSSADAARDSIRDTRLVDGAITSS
jgi:hypothetical protein